MSYDHRDRIGNEGDVVKHAVLARFVQEIVMKSGQDTFVYAESHTGWAVYTDLPPKGRWRFGIGPLSRSLLKLEHSAGSIALAEKYPNLMVYKQACFDKEIAIDGKYPGSSQIVLNIVKSAGRPYRFMLWDYSGPVCEALRERYKESPHIAVNLGDGYEGVAGIPWASLVLVDPVDVRKDQEKILNVLRGLKDKDIPFLCWTALVRGQEADFQDFRGQTEPDFSVHWVLWKPKEGTTMGCQITVPKGTWGQIAAATLREVRELMEDEWR